MTDIRNIGRSLGNFRINIYKIDRGVESLRWAPASIRCSITDLMGAIPVPGPTHMTGVSAFPGKFNKPFLIPT